MKRSLSLAFFSLWFLGLSPACNTEVLEVVRGNGKPDGGVEADVAEWEEVAPSPEEPTPNPESTDPTQHTVPYTINVSSGQNSLGIWLWTLEGTGYASHDMLASDLAAIGVKRIYVKVADGGYSASAWPEIADKSLVQAYLSRGIEPWGWAYNYPGNEAAQAKALLEAAKTGYKGFVTDIEIEFDGKIQALESLFTAFTNARKEAVSAGYTTASFKLYCTTWGNPKDHNMHVEIIDKYVDAHMPQTYLEVWGGSYMQTATTWVQAGTQEYKTLGAKKPIHHIISAEKGVITAAQIDAAFAASGRESSLWRVPGTGTPLTIWNTVKAVNWHKDFGGGQSGSITLSCQNVFQVGEAGMVSGKASGAIRKVVATMDNYKIHEMDVDSAGNYSFAYTFNTPGENRVLKIKGLNLFGDVLAEVSTLITVVPYSNTALPGKVSTSVPSSAVVGVPVNFTGTATGAVRTVVVTVDGWEVASKSVNNGAYSFSYAFYTAGLDRQVVTKGYDEGFNLLSQDVDLIDVKEPAVGSDITLNLPAIATVGVPATISGTASSNVKSVKLEIAGKVVAQTSVTSGAWSTSYQFPSPGQFVQVSAKGYGSDGTFLVATAGQMSVEAAPAAASLTLKAPTEATVGVATTFSGTVAGAVVSIVVTVDGWQIAQLSPAGSNWSFQYSFSNAGLDRQVSATALGNSGGILAVANATIDVFEAGQMQFLKPADQAVNPVVMEVQAGANVKKVEYYSAGQFLGQSTNAALHFPVSYTFLNLGYRILEARGLDSSGANVATTTIETFIYDSNSIEFLSPVGSETKNPVTFTVQASPNITKVEYWVDNTWLIGTKSNPAQKFELTYSFDQTGERDILVKGFDNANTLVASKTRTLTILSDGVDVPYFYQYNNDNEPCCTCANTSTAMLLKWYGWSGDPDTIYAKYGKTTAQSPTGLASVFNFYATQMGIPQRLVAHTNGTVQQVRNLLAQGKPVIVHGYFTGSGHVLMLLAFDSSTYEYVVNDPAGKWAQTFMGGYPYAWSATVGKGIRYSASAVDAAIATSNGSAPVTVWYHEITE